MKNIKIKLEGKDIQCLENQLLSDVILKNNIPLSRACNLMNKCGKCKVQVINANKNITILEDNILTKNEIEKGIRLACCTTVFNDMIVENISKETLNIIKCINNNEKIEIINPKFKKYGIAVDIGTTTLVLRIYDKQNCIFSISSINPQINMGLDVITRIEESLKGNLNKLQELIICEINNMINESCRSINICNSEIDYAVLTGNTTMLYLFTGLEPTSIAKAPFISDTLFDMELNSTQAKIDISKEGKIYLPKCISAFVGADITTAILASNMIKEDKKTLLIDIGTNGEIALWSNDKLYTCSTAAGPAFEGAELLNGMCGTTGAIESIFIEDNEIKHTVIDNVKPKGICGSGVIDLLSTLIDIKAIDETGYLEEDILRNYNILDKSRDETAVCIENILFTQRDVRKIQLAKSSIHAGILSILEISNLSIIDIDEFYIAGGFGYYINLEKAVNIGLIPKELLEKTKVIGNAALNGCSMMLCNNDSIDYIKDKIKNSVNVDLSKSKIFNNYYIEHMGFNNVS